MKQGESVLIMKNTSALSKALFTEPCFLTSISRSGRTTRWSCDKSAAMRKTRAQWERITARYDRIGGRLVKP